jgi:hypothetical protein
VTLWSRPLYGEQISVADPIGRGYPHQGVPPVARLSLVACFSLISITRSYIVSKSTPKILTSAFAACTLLGLGAAPAPAASSSGAQTYKQNFCEDYGAVSVCSEARGAFNVVDAPSGNLLFQDYGRYEYSVYLNGALYYSQKGSYHGTALYREGEPILNYAHGSQEFTQNGETCTYSYALHFVNGQVQFNNTDWSCVPA